MYPIIRITHDLKVNPSKAWDIFKEPDRVDWVPGVESCHFDGEIRSLNLPGAGEIKERITILMMSSERLNTHVSNLQVD